MVSWTIRQAIETWLSDRYHMSREDILEFMEFAIQELNRTYQETLNSGTIDLDHMEGFRREMAMVAECWDRDVDNYSLDWQMSLQDKVEYKALPWCIKRINILEATLQEIHRLST